MASLQYVIDTICSSLTTKFVYEVIETNLKQSPITVGEIIPLIKCKDGSLDMDSAKNIVEAAFEELIHRGQVIKDGDLFLSIA